MAAIPVKPEYGPTLGRLLAPRWRAAGAAARVAVIAGGLVLLAAAAGVVLTLESASYTHSGRVSFSFNYRGLHRVAPERGAYVRVVSRGPGGTLLYSYGVGPLTLPPYAGESSGAVPVYAARYVTSLRRRYTGFVLMGEGKTKVNTVPAYDVLYTAVVEGRRMFGRDVLLVPERPGAREGVYIAMLTAEGVTRQVRGPMEVGTVGVLAKPLRSFALG
jgi:hypothetical protein